MRCSTLIVALAVVLAVASVVDACGNGGTCKNINSCTGTVRRGLCPGGVSNICCEPKSTSAKNYGSCPGGGKCQDINSCGGKSVRRGLCPGPSNIICCGGSSSSSSTPASTGLQARVVAEATKMIGVREVGGNNRGQKVTEIIRANGGTGPEPWCGDFVAWCYRHAGSRAVSRSWASVAALAALPRTYNPVAGDIVRFTFSHTGIYIGPDPNRAGYIITIEGNTGATGAVSDSRNGGDGVYKKSRAKSLVADYRHVTY